MAMESGGGHLPEAVLDGRGGRAVLYPHTSQLNPICFTLPVR